MGRASSSKKVARATKVAGSGSSRSFVWPAAVAAVVILGVLLVAVSRGGHDGANEAPVLGDHWHAAYGIDDCGTFAPPLTDVSPEDPLGLHTHGDGLMHIHPFTTAATGKRATIGTWSKQVGLALTDTSVKTSTVNRKNGQDCNGAKGTVQLWVWDSANADARRIKDHLADYRPQDGSLFTIAFLAEGAEVPKPPSSVNLTDPVAAEEGRTTPAESGGTSTTATTTAPGASGSTTTAAP
jgi:hypothetical protein